MRLILHCLIAIVLGFTAAAKAAHTEARLILSAGSARPGDTVLAGIHMRMESHWHTYWRNSGASGIPTTVKWDLPDGFTAGEIQWPVPGRLPPDDLLTYIYEDEVVLLVPLKLSPNLKPGEYELKGTASWLECKEQCLPGKAEVTAKLQVGNETSPSPDAALIDAWQKKLPRQGDQLSAKAAWDKPVKEDLRPVVLEWSSPSSSSEADFYPFASDDFEVQGATERLPSDNGKIRVRKLVKKFQGDWPKQISGLLIHKSESEKIGYEVTLSVSPASGAAVAVSEASRPVLAQSIWKMLLYAFIGGLILNVMPCVLPVIALKILGFVSEARNEPRHVRKLGLVYGLGVLTSFVILAAIVIGIKAAGHKAGWGMQFGSPIFLVSLTVLVTLVALNLFGIFDINLSGGVMNAAGTLAAKHGTTGAFFNGVLATVLATPCTAPFLGAALGFAFAQPPLIIVLIFLTVGLGLAFPYVLLSWNPAWLKFVPKPGAWMEKFKIAMGFPMLATAVWLFSLASIHYAERSWWLAIFLVFVGLSAWIFGEFVQRGSRRRGMALAIAVALLFLGYGWVVEGQLRWREPVRETATSGPLAGAPSGLNWERWSPDAVAKARAEGRPVLVDFTAKWCPTCNTFVKGALESASVVAKARQSNTATLLADYTRFPPEITDELARYGRAGVPLVLVYPKDPMAPAIVLPEVPTPGMVLEALEHAAN